MAITIGKKKIGPDEPVFIIAEIGVNHNGDVNLAKQMISAAADTGVDAVKFQAFISENLVTPYADKAEYQVRAGAEGDSQLEMLKKLELSKEDFIELKTFSEEKGLIFISSVFDEESLQMLVDIGTRVIKLGSGEVTNLPLVEAIAKTKLPLILSTGMSDLLDVKESVDCYLNAQGQGLVLMHCTSSYPTPPEEANVSCVTTLRNAFEVPTGFSDHTIGTLASEIAVSIGAVCIEKHFTIDKNLPGPDQQASSDPEELKLLVEIIRKMEINPQISDTLKNEEQYKIIFGSTEKTTTPSEHDVMKHARRSLHANCNISKGEIITENMVSIVRPLDGLPPKYLKKVIGCKSLVDIQSGDPFTFENVDL